MDRFLESFQGPTQNIDEDDLNLPDEEFVHEGGTVIHDDDELMLSDDDFDRNDANQRNDDSMLPGDDLDAQKDNVATYGNLGLDILRYLPENALMTDSVNLLHADGRQQRYLTILNTPVDNYVVQKINDGHEFAIGGDPSHILKSLDREFAYQPQQRWHVVVIPEDNIELVGAPRRSFPLVSGNGSFETTSEGVQSQQSINFGDSLINGGPVNLAHQNYGLQNYSYQADPEFNGPVQPRQHIFGDGLVSQGPANPPRYGCTHPAFVEPIQPQQNNAFNDLLVKYGSKETSFHSSEDQGAPVQQYCDLSTPSQAALTSHSPSQPPTFSEHSKRKRSRRASTEHEHQNREEEKKQKDEDSAIIEADDCFESYSGTNLCRWCGRRGHEAVQCIKWDPEHFDKLVCIVCNNKKHLIDECLRFDAMPDEDKVKLLLVDGANRPGARSFFWPWVRVFQTSFILSSPIQPIHSRNHKPFL